MTYAPVNYTEAESGITVAAGELTAVMESVRTAIARIEAADSRMTALAQAAPVGYLGHIQWINAQATALPSDQAIMDLKRRSDKLSADFGTVQAYVQALIAAVQGV